VSEHTDGEGKELLSKSRRRARLLPLALMGLAVVFNLWNLRAEPTPVRNLNDSSIHASMVRWASTRVESGHLPLDGWYPNLSLGSSRFHRYHSLPHVLTGTLAAVLETDRMFAWSLYLLVALWPIAVFLSGRLLGWGRWESSFAAMLSPLVASELRIGYEYGAYVWRGYGLWPQLWGMWLLPLALGLSWRTVEGRGRAWLAGLVMALAIGSHFITGYLAVLSIGVFVLVKPAELARRAGRATVLVAGAILTASWALVPLVADRAYSPIQRAGREFVYDSYGAGRVLSWLVTGKLFDGGRFPVLTFLVAAGLIACLLRARSDGRARALLGLGLLGLLLFFGRPTLGPLLRLLPASEDLLLRRFLIGVHLAGVLLAGVGGVAIARVAHAAIVEKIRGGARPIARALLVVVGIEAIAPALMERARYLEEGAAAIRAQWVADATDGADVAFLVARASALGGGRVFAGPRFGWGERYEVGGVPLYDYLLELDADTFGYYRPSWSLSSAVEMLFDEGNSDHYRLFGVRYLLLPLERQPPIPARVVEERGDHVLWEVAAGGYLDLVETTEPVTAGRADLAQVMAPFLASDLPSRGAAPTVAFGGERTSAPATLSAGSSFHGSPGRVIAERARLSEGVVEGRVVLDRPAAVVLKASFDPRWEIAVDGVAYPPQMIAPSFVGRVLSPGPHTVEFRYLPFPRYDVLLLVGALALAALALAPTLARRRGRPSPRRRDATEGTP